MVRVGSKADCEGGRKREREVERADGMEIVYK